MPPTYVLRPGILERRFRSSPQFRAVRLAELPDGQARGLRALREANPHLVALFVPTEPGRSIKAAGPRAEELFRRLAVGEGGPLVGEGIAVREAATLVLDGVFEVESGAGWTTGSSAIDVLLSISAERAHSSSGTSRVSEAALRHAVALPTTDPARLADRLYRYNRAPASAAFLRELPDELAVARRLGLDPTGGAPLSARAGAASVEPVHDEHWLRWRLRSGTGPGRGRAVHKLYVSPGLCDLRVALDATFDLFSEDRPPFAVKVGRGPRGVLRSDKLVAYFRGKDSLLEAAHRLAGRLGGAQSQPVPFTSDLGADGLLSYGVDPPPEAKLAGWRHGDSSWRAWITGRLGSALATAKALGGGGDPTRTALARVAVEGVDTSTWSPALDLWNPPAEPA